MFLLKKLARGSLLSEDGRKSSFYFCITSKQEMVSRLHHTTIERTVCSMYTYILSLYSDEKRCSSPWMPPSDSLDDTSYTAARSYWFARVECKSERGFARRDWCRTTRPTHRTALDVISIDLLKFSLSLPLLNFKKKYRYILDILFCFSCRIHKSSNPPTPGRSPIFVASARK